MAHQLTPMHSLPSAKVLTCHYSCCAGFDPETTARAVPIWAECLTGYVCWVLLGQKSLFVPFPAVC